MSIVKMDSMDLYNNKDDALKIWGALNNFLSSGGVDGGGAIESDNSSVILSWPEQNTIRIAFWLNFNNSTSGMENDDFLIVKDNTGNDIFRLVVSNDVTGMNLNPPDASPFQIWSPINHNVWQWFEIEAVKGASGSITIYKNGSQQYTGSHDLSNVDSGFTSFEIITRVKIDDVVIWNDDGSGLTSFPMGDHKIAVMRPNAIGSSSDFTPNGEVSNELTVDDSPGPDDDTTYNQSGNPGDRDLFTTTDFTETVSSITAVQLTNIAKKSDIGGVPFSNVIKSGTTIDTVSKSLGSVSFYVYFQDLYESNPDTGTSWTKSEVNNLEIGYEV